MNGLSSSPRRRYGIHTIPDIGKLLEQKELCVIPAKAGIQEIPQISGGCGWIPAFAHCCPGFSRLGQFEAELAVWRS
ncbi:hypothetical protein, partial [Azospirillum sp. Sh1]|uniref:hypothetical protein n=1 Tax=Azospirillum sp. Sh1 TaxID=2607285 RepID=UPI001B3BA63A